MNSSSIRKLATLFFILATSMSSYGGVSNVASANNNSDVEIGSVHTEDVDVSKATEEARKTVGELISVLNDRSQGGYSFGIKILLVDGDIKEHMWISHLKYDNGEFTGILGNTPLKVHNVKLGHIVVVKKNDIIDWAYMKDRKMMGNFTLKALFPHMNPIEVTRIKEQLGWL